jgi:hypothetical protein
LSSYSSLAGSEARLKPKSHDREVAPWTPEEVLLLLLLRLLLHLHCGCRCRCGCASDALEDEALLETVRSHGTNFDLAAFLLNAPPFSLARWRTRRQCETRWKYLSHAKDEPVRLQP